MPYLIGPNSEPMTPKPNSATNRIGTECIAKPATASIATPISANFKLCATVALSYRSAISPPNADRKK